MGSMLRLPADFVHPCLPPWPRYTNFQARSRLYSLPPEIRNMIYRLSLIGDTPVAVTATGMTEPGLLSTCKIIRHEAGGIFYDENTFIIDITDYQPEAVTFWAVKSGVAAFEFNLEGQANLKYSGRPQPNWKNLITWVARYHAFPKLLRMRKPSDCEDPFKPSRSRRATVIVGSMFHIAESLRYYPWTLVEKIVSEQRIVLATLDKQWMVD